MPVYSYCGVSVFYGEIGMSDDIVSLYKAFDDFSQKIIKAKQNKKKSRHLELERFIIAQEIMRHEEETNERVFTA